MESVVEFFIGGTPRPGGSKISFNHPKTQKKIYIDGSKYNRAWKAVVKDGARQKYKSPLMNGPLEVFLNFKMPRPKSHFINNDPAKGLKATAPKFHTSKPDCTKLARSTEDALTGAVWSDDSRIIFQHHSKMYCMPGNEGVHVKIVKVTHVGS